MSDDRWVIVPNWPKFQHYADRDPVWIKLYLELRSRDDWRILSLAARGLLVSIWIEFAASNGQLRSSDLPRRVAHKIPRRALETLETVGLVKFRASKPLALTRSRTRSREAETEKTPQTPHRENSKPRRRVTGWRQVKGSHGMTTIPDPNGTDPAPTIGRPL